MLCISYVNPSTRLCIGYGWVKLFSGSQWIKSFPRLSKHEDLQKYGGNIPLILSLSPHSIELSGQRHASATLKPCKEPSVAIG
jgi:hypothetical protein